MADASTTYLLNKIDSFVLTEAKLRGSIEENIVELKNEHDMITEVHTTLPCHPALFSSEHRGGVTGVAPLYTPEVEIVGVEGAREKLASWALDVEQAYRGKFIVGKAGSGKTALVKLVYDQLKMDFDCHAWLTVSKFEWMGDLLSTMFNKLCKGTTVSSSTPYKLSKGTTFSSSTPSSQDLIEALRDYYKERRYSFCM